MMEGSSLEGQDGGGKAARDKEIYISSIPVAYMSS